MEFGKEEGLVLGVYVWEGVVFRVFEGLRLEHEGIFPFSLVFFHTSLFSTRDEVVSKLAQSLSALFTWGTNQVLWQHGEPETKMQQNPKVKRAELGTQGY